jgi:hypothetical protein
MRQRMLMVVLIGVATTFGSIVYVTATTSAGPRPANYRAAVMRVLDTQGVDYRDVEVIDGCAPSEQRCRSYAGTVRVRNGMIMAGQIDCRERWITCTITVPQAGISGVALDDTIDPVMARWEDFCGQFLLWLRSASRGFPASWGSDGSTLFGSVNPLRFAWGDRGCCGMTSYSRPIPPPAARDDHAVPESPHPLLAVLITHGLARRGGDAWRKLNITRPGR